MKLILASTSPRRQQLMQMLQVHFETAKPNFDENSSGLAPKEEALHFAKQKALSLKDQYKNALIVGCDTLIECEGKIIGKPKDINDASAILNFLSGKTHLVHSALSAYHTQNRLSHDYLVSSAVTFKTLSTQMINEYLALDKPLDKAGAYAIQENARMLIEKFDGDILATIGLPLGHLAQVLTTYHFKINQGFLNHMSTWNFMA